MFAGPAGVSYRTRDRKWYSSQVAVICSRQNLKTACMEMGVLGALWLLDALPAPHYAVAPVRLILRVGAAPGTRSPRRFLPSSDTTAAARAT